MVFDKNIESSKIQEQSIPVGCVPPAFVFWRGGQSMSTHPSTPDTLPPDTPDALPPGYPNPLDTLPPG